MSIIENQQAYDSNEERERYCQAWLKEQKNKFRWQLYQTASIGVLQGVLLILQSALLAFLLQQILIEERALKLLLTEFTTLLVIAVLRAISTYYYPLFGFKLAEQLKSSIRQQLQDKFSQLGPAFCHQHQSGELAATSFEHIEALENYYARYLPQQIIVSVLPLLMIAVVMPVNWVVGIIFLLTAPLIPLFMVLVGMGAASASRRQFLTMARMSAYFLDRLQGLSTLKLFSQAEAEAIRIQGISSDFRQKTMEVLRIAFLSSAVLEFFSALAVALLAVYVGLGLLGLLDFGPAENITLQEALFVLLLAPEFFNPLKQLAVFYHDKAAAIGAADNILKILQQAVTENEFKQRDFSAVKPEYAIELQEVNKSFQQQQLFNDFNLQIKAGEKVAVIGESGAGKTTLINLLLGFEQAGKGRVLIQGEKASVENTVKNIAWLGQQSTIFYGSIKDNISLGDQAVSEQAIIEAADQAGVLAFASELEQGLMTRVGEKGYGLSGGQVRRIVLARALIKNAPIIVLDEPTAHLEHDLKISVLNTIAELFKDKTLLIISHDDEVIDRMDRIVELA